VFFRHPWLHLLPLFLMLAVGVTRAVDHDTQYRATATMSARDQSLLSDVTATNDSNFRSQTEAERAVGQIGLLLGTDPFLRTIATAAGEPADTRLGPLRASVGTSVIGDSLVQVSVTTRDPELARRIADATVKSYIDYVARTSVEEGTDTEAKTTALVTKAEADRNAANDAVKEFLTEHPNAVGANAPPVLAQDLLLRQSEFQLAEQRYSAARAAQDQADREAGTAGDVVRQRLALLIPAVAPQAPEPVLRTMVLTIALFAVLGLLLSLAGVVLAGSLDRTVRVPDDVTAQWGLEVVAVIPDVRR
jgi:uncharacterized protein involved in exopolysaccharide biosynthesis